MSDQLRFEEPSAETVQIVSDIIERLSRDQKDGVDTFAAGMGLSASEMLELEDEQQRGDSAVTQLLAKRICTENQLDKAAQWAYLADCKTEAYAFRRIASDIASRTSAEADDSSLEKEIRDSCQLPDRLVDVSYEILLKVAGLARAKEIFQRLGVPEDSAAKGLCNWIKTDAVARVRELFEVLCDLGHFAVARDLLQEGEVRGFRRHSSLSNLSSTLIASTPELIQVPDEDEHFVGRKEEVKKLRSGLEDHQYILLYGMPGIGKTFLATSFAYAVRDEYSAIVFITCSSVHGFDHSLQKVHQDVTKSNMEHRAGTTTDSELLEYMKYWLKQRGKTLLIFDGLHDIDLDLRSISDRIHALVNKAVSQNRNLHCLFTSREKVSDIAGLTFGSSRVQELKELSSEEVTDMLIKRCEAGDLDGQDLDAVKWIAEETDGIPQLADLIANVIKQKGCTFFMYQNIMSMNESLIPSDDTSREAALKVTQFYKQIISETARTRALRELLLVMAFSDHPEPVPLDLFIIGAEGLVKGCGLQEEYRKQRISLGLSDKVRPSDEVKLRDRTAAVSFMTFNELLMKLQKSHLIHYELKGKVKTVWIHSESSKQVREMAEREWKDCKLQQGLDILSSLLLTVYKADRTGKKGFYEALVSHTHKFIRIMSQRKRPVNSDLLLHFGRILSLLGSFQEARDLLEQCESSSKFREDVVFRGLTLRHLGTVRRRLGHLPDAEKLLSRAVQVWEDHAEYSDQLNETQTALAEVLMDASEFEKAHSLMIEFKNGSDLGAYYGNIGRALYGLRAYRESMESFDKALEEFKDKNEYKRELFTIHRDVAEAALAACSDDVTKFQVAMKKCLNAEERLITVHGPNHRYVAFAQREIARHQLAALLHYTGPISCLESALEFAFNSLKGHAEVFGAEHQKVAKSSDIIAQVCSLIAEPLYQDSRIKTDVVLCQELALRRAISNFEKIKVPKFPAVEKIIDNLEKRWHHDYRGSFGDLRVSSSVSSGTHSSSSSTELIVRIRNEYSGPLSEEEDKLHAKIKLIVAYYQDIIAHETGENSTKEPAVV